MNKLYIVTAAAITATVAFARVPPIPADKAARVGGFLERPDAPKTFVAFANAQKTVPESEMTEVVNELSRILHANIELVKAENVTLKTAASTLKSIPDAAAAVFLVENPDCPNTILIAPESRYAFVNISALAADGAAPAYVNARTRKEMVRAFLSLCGGTDSNYSNSLMGKIDKVSDLDKFTNYQPPMDVVGRSRKFLPEIGVDTRGMVVYGQAVKEGWAPAPTNDVQKAIWDRIHSEKERGPVNGLKIVPPNKKLQPKK